MKTGKTQERRRFRKDVMLALFLLLLMAAGIAGTYMFDEEVSKSNTIEASVFDIKVNDTDRPGPIFDHVVIEPGGSVVATVPVRLIGSGTGRLEITFEDLKNGEGSFTEPEMDFGNNATTDPLSNYVYVSVNGGSRSTLKDGLTKTVGTIRAGETTEVVIKIDGKTTMDDSLQGDFCNFDIVFTCEQISP